MHRYFTLCTLALLAPALGCHASSQDVAPDERNAQDPEAIEARRVVIEGVQDPAQIESLARQLEGLAEIHAAEVRIRKSEDGSMNAEIELAGFDLPSDAELREEIRDHGGFDSAEVRTEPVSAQALMAGAEANDDKSVEEIKAEVEQRLRDQGIDGEVHVDVYEEDGERRVEVRVEKKEPAPAEDAPDDLAAEPE